VFPAARPAAGAEARPADELMYVKLRYKAPTDSVSVPMEVIVPNRVTAASEEFRFVQAVAAFGMTLRASEYRGNATAAMSLELAGGALGADPHGYRSDFIDLVRSYERLRGVAEAPKR
jgi:Ca-activated chloride channel family protein